jgi:hypothetical protein
MQRTGVALRSAAVALVTTWAPRLALGQTSPNTSPAPAPIPVGSPNMRWGWILAAAVLLAVVLWGMVYARRHGLAPR